MGWSPVARRLPGQVRARLGLRRGQVLAHAVTPGGSTVVAAVAALYVVIDGAGQAAGEPTGPSSQHPDGHRVLELPWERIERVTWEGEWMHVSESDTASTHRLWLPDPGVLPGVVHERVTATILVDTQVSLSAGGAVRIVGRRPPRGDSVDWRLSFPEELDPADPLVHAQAQRALADIRYQAGV